MKPNTNVITQTGNLGGEKVAMSFDENSISHLMGLLTNLYSNPELAVVREYSGNALDSHKEAGNPAPIEISTPNRLSPFFKIKDYGVGMSADDIRQLYSKYGASTKRDSNEVTGMMGIGSKSALTYTNQFVLIGVKDGVLTHVAISRSSDGGGVMEIINEAPTDLPNGVEIQIPVQRHHRFDATCAEFFKYWDRDTVLINEQPPAENSFIKIDENFYIDPLGNSDKIVMGGISYDVSQLNRDLKHHAVVYVPIGAVDFVPSREELHYTPRTTAYIDQLKADIKNMIQKHIDTSLTNAKTKAQALKQSEFLHKIIDRQNIYWNKELVPYTFRHNVIHVRGEGWPAQKGYAFSPHKVLVTGFKLKQVSAAHKKKVDIWKTNNNIPSNQELVLMDELPISDWLIGYDTVSWTDINSISVAVPKPKQKRVIKPLEVYDFSTETEVQGVPAGKTLLYWFKSEKLRPYALKEVIKYLSNTVVAEIQPRQEESFKKKHRAISFNEYIKQQIALDIEKIPDNLPDIFKNAYEDDRWAYGKRVHDYDDPDIKAIIIRAGKSDPVDPQLQKYQDLIHLGRRWDIATDKKINEHQMPSIINSRYPVANNYYTSSGNLPRLMNAMYWYYYAPNAPKKGK